ncbi:hypothetical protein UFOVP115_32 [uncultured Caudovirales phage]|uniref:Uncharacterized protein n=1 Tax=uncultured Caudovirales phage TaxID=2100421 RepID=A0A6J5L4X1_9CAUD|nr:hypothetical protein UFOVP115_32 [uncultured Caudovirales phage]
MRRVTIAVIGNAKTTRANVEALIGDVVDSVDEAVLAAVYDQSPSDGQTWAVQYAQDKEIPLLQYSNNDYDALFSEVTSGETKFFMLWDDEDPACQVAASVAQERRILAYDLTDGLISIPLNSEPIARPVKAEIPVAEEVAPEVTTLEVVVEPTKEAPEEVVTDFEDDEDWELSEIFMTFIDEAAKVFARKVAAEVKNILKG